MCLVLSSRVGKELCFFLINISANLLLKPEFLGILAETQALICNLLRPFRDAEKGELSVYTPASSHICHFCNGKVCMLGARFTEISERGLLLLPLSLSVCLLSVRDRYWIC